MLYEGRPSLRQWEIFRNFAGLGLIHFLPLYQLSYQFPMMVLYGFSFLLWVLTPPKSQVNVLSYVPEKKVQ